MITTGARNPPWRRLMATCAAPCPAPMITAESLIGIDLALIGIDLALAIPCDAFPRRPRLQPGTVGAVSKPRGKHGEHSVRAADPIGPGGTHPPGGPLNCRPFCVHVGTARTGGWPISPRCTKQ